MRSVRRKDTADDAELAPHAPTPGTGEDNHATREDAAAIARAEVAKLAVMVRYLKDRLADAEARAAEGASQRALLQRNASGASIGIPEMSPTGSNSGLTPSPSYASLPGQVSPTAAGGEGLGAGLGGGKAVAVTLGAAAMGGAVFVAVAAAAVYALRR